ncbi:hypothetical protein K439DRAFT_1259679, partial [Ramaria rubella]
LISYFKLMADMFSCPPFYTDDVHLPDPHGPTSPEIKDNTKLFPYFKDAIGALDSTHINCTTSAAEHPLA